MKACHEEDIFESEGTSIVAFRGNKEELTVCAEAKRKGYFRLLHCLRKIYATQSWTGIEIKIVGEREIPRVEHQYRKRVDYLTCSQ